MIFLLYGRDTYRSRKRLGEISAEFEKKTGAGLAVTRIDVSEEPVRVLGLGRTASLFSAKELFVIERASEGSPEVQGYIHQNVRAWGESKDRTFVFWEEELSKSDAFRKLIEKHATKTQEFKTLDTSGLGRWIMAESSQRGIRLTPGERQVLLLKTNGDLWAIGSELGKLEAGAKLNHSFRNEETIFAFTDSFLERPRSAFRPLASLLDRGEEPIMISATLAGALRSLATVWWGLRTQKLKSATKSLHPFVVKKYMKLAGVITPGALREAYEGVISADISLKTGRLPSPLPLVKLVVGTKRKSPR